MKKTATKTAHLTEHQIQATFVAWLELHYREFPALCLGLAVPNQAVGRSTEATKARLCREGLRAGFPDWILPVACGDANGLAIEFKSANGRLTQKQRAWLSCLYQAQWSVAVMRDAASALSMTLDYINGDLGHAAIGFEPDLSIHFSQLAEPTPPAGVRRPSSTHSPRQGEHA